ncbi:MAG: AAA family ATPase [Piscinibacter sp.]
MDSAANAGASAPRTVPGLHMRLLGELELRRGDAEALVLPPSRRTRALLGYLVATRSPQLRSALCDMFWDGPGDPRAALRWSLTKLRAVVDDDTVQRLQADRDRVGFELRDCEVDSVAVDMTLGDNDPDHLPLDTLEAMARALQGEFLDGLELPACYRFHQWCMAERERYGRARRAVLHSLVTRLAGDPPRALRYGRAMVAADPLAEGPHAALVRLLAADGRYPEAETHYGWARDLLRREVALPDGGVLDQAIRAVRQQQRHAAASRPPAEPAHAEPAVAERRTFVDLLPAAPARSALVGRDDECRAIDAALAATRPASVLLLIGEPGIGKTRLLDHLGERAQALGRRVIRARCFEAEALRPYGFWLDALRGLPTDGASTALLERAAPLLGSAAGEGSVQGRPVGREQLFDAAAELLAGLAQRQPLALLVDDLQWIDDASAALLHFVVRRLAHPPLPVLFAAAARVGEVDDNAAAKGLLQSLSREHALQQHDLAPLAEESVRGWLGDRLPDLAEAMRASGGNPLLLTELARAGGGTPRGERSLDALVDERLRAFDEAARDLLGWAAALGGEFDAERLAAATTRPLTEVLSRIAQFERRGLLRAAGDGGFDFTHGLVRQAVYRGLSAARRRALHRQIARAFEVASVDDPWLHGAVLHHASLAGDAPLATRAALAAGQHWLRVFANVEAAQVAERGLALVDDLAPGAQRARLEIGLLRVRVAAASAPGGRRLPELSERIEQAIDTAQALALHGDAAAAWEILSYWRQQSGDAAGASAASLAAEARARLADAATRCEHLANTGRCLLDIEGDSERARALLADAAALAAELQLPVMELEWGRGLAARADGDLAAAREALTRAVALARAGANHWREYECMLALATVEYELGRIDEVLGHVRDVAAAAQRMGEAQVPFADALAALARWRRGDADAADAVDASLAALRERDDKAHLAYALNESAAGLLAAGRGADAARRAREAQAAAGAVRRPTQVARALSIIAAADTQGAAPPRPAP